MAKLQKDLREFIESLSSHGVEYLIVGGHAVAFHGYPRYTGDIDFWIRRSSPNAARIVAALNAFGFASAGLRPQDFLAPDRIVQLGFPPNRIDLLTSVSGVEFDEAWDSRVHAKLEGLPVTFVSRDVLLRNKRASGRAQDLADVERLTRMGGRGRRKT